MKSSILKIDYSGYNFTGNPFIKLLIEYSSSPDTIIVKITVILQLSCPYVLILTFFDPIACTVVDLDIFKCMKVSSMLPLNTIHNYFCFLILYYKKEIIVS